MLARVCLPVFAWHFTGFVTFPWVQVQQSPKGMSRRCQQIVSHCTYLPFNASIALARRRAPLWMQQLRMAASLQGSKATLLGQRTLGRWTVWCPKGERWEREWTTAFLHFSSFFYRRLLNFFMEINICKKGSQTPVMWVMLWMGSLDAISTG